MVVVFSVAAVVVLLDQISKSWVVASMPGRAPIQLAGDWLQITYTRNPGAAFSMGGGLTIVLSLVAVGRHRLHRSDVVPAGVGRVGDRSGWTARWGSGQPERRIVSLT